MFNDMDRYCMPLLILFRKNPEEAADVALGLSIRMMVMQKERFRGFVMPRKMQRMCSWCGKHPARIAGSRKYLTWCSKKCQDAELDNNMSMEYGIDMDEVRETLAKIKNNRR